MGVQIYGLESSFERISVRDSTVKGIEWFPRYVRMTDSWPLFPYSPLHQTCSGYNRKRNREHAAVCCSSGQGSGAMAVSRVAPSSALGGSLTCTVVLWLSGGCLWRSHFHTPQILKLTNLLSKASIRVSPYPTRLSSPQLKSSASSGKSPFIYKHSWVPNPTRSIRALGSRCPPSSFFCCSPGIRHHKAPPKQHRQHPWPAPRAVLPSADSSTSASAQQHPVHSAQQTHAPRGIPYLERGFIEHSCKIISSVELLNLHKHFSTE